MSDTHDDKPSSLPHPHPHAKPMMRSVGEFFGHILHGFRAPIDRDGPATHMHEARRDTEQTVQQADGQKIVLRRTTIEEIELTNESTNETTT